MPLVNYEGAEGAFEVIEDGFDQWFKIYNDTGAALNEGDVYFFAIGIDADDSKVRPLVKACATSAIYRQIVVIENSHLGLATIADKAWGFVKYRGFVNKMKMAAAIDSVSAHAYIQGANASQEAAEDGTTITTDSFAATVSISGGERPDGNTDAGYGSAILLGRPVLIG